MANAKNERELIIHAFNTLVCEQMNGRTGLQDRQRAIRSVASAHPELYKRYLWATNPGSAIPKDWD